MHQRTRKPVERDEDHAADEAPLLGEDREREVAVLLGQEHELVLRPLHEALAEPAAVADRDARLVGVPVVAEDVLVRVQPRVDALVLVAAQAVAPEDRAEEQAGARRVATRRAASGRA